MPEENTPAAPVVEAPEPVNGFPAQTPVTEMAPEQQAAYWKHHSRKHESAVKAYEGRTPQQIAELESELNALKAERMSAEEKAITEAVSQATQATRAEVEKEWQSKYHTARLEAIAGQVLTDKDQLESFMSVVDTAKFVKDGDIDTDALRGHLTKMYGHPREFGSGLAQHRDWGQNTTRAPGMSGIEQGKAEAARRAQRHTPT